MGIHWQSSGQDSALPLQEAQVRSLVGEVRSHMPCSVAKKKKKERERERETHLRTQQEDDPSTNKEVGSRQMLNLLDLGLSSLHNYEK